MLKDKFQAWFGKSKVVDDRGQPLIVYHGTPHLFSEFKSSEGDHLGHHFGSLDQAKERLRREKNEGEIITAYLSIQNPLITLDAGDWSNSYRVWEIINKATKGALGEYNFKLNEMTKRKRMSILTQMIKSLGYDGIAYRNRIEGKGVSWIALRSQQIKSVDNDGTFDADDPDIRSNPDLLQFIKSGRLVKDVLSRSPDAEFILDGDEVAFEWREVELPIHVFGLKFHQSEIRETPARTNERIAVIRKWMTQSGGWKKAIQSSPILALFVDGKLELLDGWHRMKAASAGGVDVVTVLVGIAP